MEKPAGRFEKRFILESLVSEKAAVIFRVSGGKSRARVSAVTADDFSLDIESDLLSEIASKDKRHAIPYVLDIGFRGLVFRSAGDILESEVSSLRLSLRDPWSLLSAPAPSPSARPSRPSLSLAMQDQRIDVRWPELFIPPVSQGISLSPTALTRLGSAFGAQLRFHALSSPGVSSPLERVLRSSGKRALVQGPPRGMPETGSRLFFGFPFLGLSEYESLSVLEGEAPEELPEPGIHAPVFHGLDCLGYLHYRRIDASQASLGPSDLFKLFAFEELAGRSFECHRSDGDILCLSLQADGITVYAPKGALPPLEEKNAQARIQLSFPEREISLLARVAASVPDGGGSLSFLDFESGRPEDFRFLFETLYALPFDGDCAEELIKKAAS